jgi:hypothetical protein
MPSDDNWIDRAIAARRCKPLEQWPSYEERLEAGDCEVESIIESEMDNSENNA